MATSPALSPPRLATQLEQRRSIAPNRWGNAAIATLLPAILVLGVAALLAGLTYSRFLEVDRFLWTNSTHDRNAHYLYALKLTTDVRDGKVLHLLADLNEGRIWPPLHGVLASIALLVGGLDYRLAVLPSLIGWVGTAWFGFMIARRAVPRGGNLAGMTAAVFILASPSYRAFATDAMLESLGACLTLAALYCNLVAVQSDTRSKWPGRFLGLSLTLLFLHKYNYWLLVVIGLGAATLTSHYGSARQLFSCTLSEISWRDLMRTQCRRKLNYVFLMLLSLIAIIYWWGDRPIVLFGYPITIYPPHNLIHAAYVVLFLRLLPWWRRTGRSLLTRMDVRLAQVARWHLLPLAIWFLLPKHPSYFLWYLSLANASDTQPFNLVEGVTSYTHWIVEDYHTASWSAILAVVLAAAAFLGRRRLRPGGRAVLWFFVIALLLTVAHPNRKGRNLHSWLAAGWVVAGMGLAIVVNGRLTAHRQRMRPWLAVAAFGAIGWAHLSALTAIGHAPEGGPHPNHVSLRDLTDSYLTDLDHAKRATVLATVPVKAMVQWTYLERFGSFNRLEENWFGFGSTSDGNRQGFVNWLQSTPCDTIVFFDRTPGPNVWEDVPDCRLHDGLRDLLSQQTVFQTVKRKEFPQIGCTVTIWRRSN